MAPAASPDNRLRGVKILVVEDVYAIACEIADSLQSCAATVLGPVGTLEKAMSLATDAAIDGALLDINLHGEMSFPVAAVLIERRIPFMFLTGYTELSIPQDLRSVIRLTKPMDKVKLIEAAVEFFAKSSRDAPVARAPT